MKKRLAILFLAVCMALTLLPMSALADTDDVAYAVEGGNIYFDKATGTVTDCDEAVTAAIIPSTIEGVAVTGIEDWAFSNCESLTSVSIPDSVTSIGEGAFYRSGLIDITVPDSVSSIGAAAFSLCESLKEIVVSSGNKSYITKDGALFTSDGKTLINYPAGKPGESYTIPDGVTVIGSGAFNGAQINGVIIPNTVITIGKEAFDNCRNLRDLFIPSSVTSIVSDSLRASAVGEITVDSGNRSYKSVDGVLFTYDLKTLVMFPCRKTGTYVIPDSVTRIEDHAFNGCFYLSNIIIPDSVTEIGEYAFDGCDGLTSIVIPASVTVIGRCAFSGCENLTSIVIPDGIDIIDDQTFSYCEKLKSITIPASVTQIESMSFDDCDELTDVYYTGSKEQWKQSVIGGFNDPLLNATIHYNSTMPAFPDVAPDAYYADAVSWAVENNITNGTDKGTFDPLDTLDRAQAVTFLWRSKGEPEPVSTANPFTDVKPTDWYYKAVLWANENNITNGTNAEGTLFSPDAHVTRGSMITFLWRAMDKPGDTGITDPARWAEDAEKWANGLGIPGGTAEAYTTGGDCPRSDVVYYLWKVLA